MTSKSSITSRNFDPFEFAPLFRWARNIHTAWLALVGLGIGAAFLVVTHVEGSFGTRSDFQLGEDALRVLGVESVASSTPTFPLIRDVTTWFLVFVVGFTCALVHRQWQLMARCIAELAGNDVLKLRVEPDTGARSRLLLVGRLISGRPPARALDTLVDKVNEFGRKYVARATVLVAGGAAFLAFSLVQGEKHGLFRVLMPRGLTGGAAQEWLGSAYHSWWASDDHPMGTFAYFLAALFAAYVVLMQNIVGIAIAYLALALPSATVLDADWLNRDGHFGWAPVARVFRTVYWSLAIHGLTLSLILVILGIENSPWVGGLVAIWVAVVPIYLVAPWLLFRKVQNRARERRLAQLGRLIDQSRPDAAEDIARMQVFVAEIERVRTAKIRPMRLRIPAFSTFILAIVLPVGLTAAQIFFSLRFGSS